MVRVDRLKGNNWNALIIGINFYNPADTIESSQNNVPILMDTQTISQDSLAVMLKRDSTVRADSIKRNETLSIIYIKTADSLVKSNQFLPALEIFEKAKDLVRFSPALTIRITSVKAEIAKNTYKNYKNKGDDAKSRHNYSEAIQYYRKADKLRNGADASVQPDIDGLIKILGVIDLPKNILQVGAPEDAVKECERILGLKENKNSKGSFPELFYIEAMAYKKILESKPDESRLKDKITENFNLAISYFANYTDAHIARADFLIEFKSDYISAITDYDALINIAPDESPEIPFYYVKKAKYKDVVRNFTGAIDDYSKAISLAPKADSFYFARGELFYRLNKFDNAQKDLDSAIFLNGKNTNALFYRGLNYVKLKNTFKAGVDFIEAGKLGLQEPQKAIIDSISHGYFVIGQNCVVKHDFITADSAFNNALKISSCNASALHGKAEIRFMYNMAIACNPNFSDAYFKIGLAQKKLSENDFAITSFSEAIRTDFNNINAYVERGNALSIQNKYAKAADNYLRALTLLKENYDTAKKDNDAPVIKEIINSQSKAHQLYGQALYYLFNYDNALITLNQAIDLNESNADALYYRGLVYYAQNELSKAIKDFEKALRISGNCWYYYNNGRAYYKIKNYENAMANFTGAIQADTLNIIKDKYFLRGLSHFKNKLINEALSDFSEYNKTESSKTDTAFYADYGTAQLFANQDTLAAKSFKQAIALSANNAKALYGLACYYAKIGQFDKTFDLFAKAFATHTLTKEDIKPEEDTFLVELNKDKLNRNRYKGLKKSYQNN